ncbi:hypothetical protein GCM10027186_18050 [Micromonospora schwarzwaldensis]
MRPARPCPPTFTPALSGPPDRSEYAGDPPIPHQYDTVASPGARRAGSREGDAVPVAADRTEQAVAGQAAAVLR